MSRSEVLRELLSGPVSGGALAERLGVSRAAIWKAVETLRGEGFEINSAPGRGYSLASVPDILAPELIHAPGWDVKVYDTLDSTNNELKRIAEAGARDMTAALADRQTGGKGRLGRSFASPAGFGMYLSVLLKPSGPYEDLSFLSAVTAVLARRAVLRLCGLPVGIKWTNDLVLAGKKLCGILTELSFEGESGSLQYVVIGIGINTGPVPEDFPDDLRAIATSLADHGAEVKRAALAGEILRELSGIYSGGKFSIDPAHFAEEYRTNCVTLGKEVKVIRYDSEERARALDIDDNFRLLVEYNDGRREAVSTGEVSVRGLYGYV